MKAAGKITGTVKEFYEPKCDAFKAARIKAVEDDPSILMKLAEELEKEISKNMLTFKKANSLPTTKDDISQYFDFAI